MDQKLTAALDVFLDYLEAYMRSPPERGAPMSHDQVQDALELLVSCNYGSAVLLRRLAAAGVVVEREDGKDMDRWVVEQVRLGNYARAAQKAHRDNRPSEPATVA